MRRALSGRRLLRLRLRFAYCPLRTFKSRLACLVVLLNIIFIGSLLRGATKSTTAAVSVRPTAVELVVTLTRNSAEAVDKTRTPILNDLDSVVIHKDLKQLAGGSHAETERCNSWTDSRPPENLEEQQRWHTVVNGLPETFVFSAYYDARTKPAAVRIIGISSGFQGSSMSASPFKFCQLWYANETTPTVTIGEYNIVPETHDMKYAASFHICYLPIAKVHGVPYAVSLVSDKCQTPNHVLKVIDNQSDKPPTVNFTVCLTPFNLKYDNFRRLVEFVETNRMFGANRFIFYNYTTGSNIGPYLRYYVDHGIADVVQWRVPVAVNVWPPDPKEEPEIHYFAQLASLNDCLYRAMFRSRFVVFSDLDELVVPRKRDTWLSMLEDITAKWQKELPRGGHARLIFPGSYLIRNVFFRTNWPNDERAKVSSAVVDLDLLTLLKTRRESYVHLWYLRSKYIVWSRLTLMVSVHSALEFVDDSRVTTVQVEDTEALLHHYRVWDGDADQEDNESVVDTRMHQYYDEIVASTSAVHDAVKHRRISHR